MKHASMAVISPSKLTVCSQKWEAVIKHPSFKATKGVWSFVKGQLLHLLNKESLMSYTACIHVSFYMYSTRVGYLWLGRACWQWCSWQRWWRHTPTPRGPPWWGTWTVGCHGAERCACFCWASLPVAHKAWRDRVGERCTVRRHKESTVFNLKSMTIMLLCLCQIVQNDEL